MSQATAGERSAQEIVCPVINGHTRVIGILADPIGHVRTPQAFNALMAAREINAVLVPLHVTPVDVRSVVTALSKVKSMAGLIITIPHKESMLSFCDELTDAARQVGAVNIVRFEGAEAGARLIGSNLDGEGFVAGLRAQGHEISGRRVYLAGAGGAGKAIAHALAAHGAGAIGVYNRTPERAEHLVGELRRLYPQLDAHVTTAHPVNYTLAVNSTSLGLNPDDALPFSVDALPTEAIVAEAVMKVELSPLLAAAQKRGLVGHFGRHMMQAQLEYMKQFLGLR
ncbi:shikimate dehydrogenase family protein [Herbaspirillum frisingense]|uniref:shikimate dehydrogenase family protein n=1 Tax=Herbaspirillum frisingense TaxID=92645 RepID=UPI001F3A4B84|nr:shikimate dehydrogenase [Herbaspirillum frisingense]UIN21213.1 shikimate dehydrogenase [Herbaspirillum frisingense]